MKQYYISEERLLELLREEAELIALENGGVNNWEWCGESSQMYLDLCGVESFEDVALERVSDFEVVGR